MYRSPTQYDLLDRGVTPYRDPKLASSPLHGLLRTSKWTRTKPALVIFMVAMVIVFQVVILVKTIWLSGEAQAFTNTQRTLYTTGITLVATVISGVAVGEIRTLWIRRLMRGTDPKRDQKVQVLLSVGEFRHSFGLFWLSLPLIVLGLITASITGSTAIAVIQRPYLKQGKLYNEPFLLQDGGCYNITSSPVNGLHNWWPLDDGTGVNQAVYGSACSLKFLWGYYTPDKLNVQYAPERVNGSTCAQAAGGLLSCSALGAPIDTRLNCGLWKSFECRLGIRNSACVPVFKKNPISCKLGAIVKTVEQANTTISVTSADGACSGTGDAGGIVSVYCPLNGTYGDATILIGAQSPDLFNPMLTKMLGVANASTVGIECSYALNDTMAFNIVTNTTTRWADGGAYYDVPTLSSTNETCDPGYGLTIEQLLTPPARIAAAYMTRDLIKDSVAAALLLPTQVTERAFPTSNNTLEDWFGVLATLGVSHYWGYNETTFHQYQIDYTVYADRVGSGQPVAIIYVLPELCAIGVLLWLWLTDR